MFELEIPREIQQLITETENQLWGELDHEKLHAECHKIEEWILDLGQTVGRASLYDKMVAFFWLMKKHVGRFAWDKKGEDSEDKYLKWRAPTSEDIQHLKSKLDFLISRLGF